MKRLFTVIFLIFSFAPAVLFAGPELKLKTVVIDAGHGGTDPGAVSADRKTYESNLTLDISKRLSERITKEYPDVKVVLSRPRNDFVSLNGRAEKANSVDADLFISIHINASTNTKANGYSIHILGQSSVKNRDLFAYNMDVCRRENSVILLEDDYSTKYGGFDPNDPESFIFMQLMQNAHLEQSVEFAEILSRKLADGPIKANRGVWQNPFYVLWKTSMPAVLVELGFISNKDDLAILRSEERRQELSDCLFEAFKTYKRSYDSSMSAEKQQPSKTEADTVRADKSGEETAATVRYGTQIFAVSRLLPPGDPSFLGFAPEIVRSGSVYKYVIGISTDKSEAAGFFAKIVKKYPDSFKVKIDGNSVERDKF